MVIWMMIVRAEWRGNVDDEVGDNYMITHGGEVDCKFVAMWRLGQLIVNVVLGYGMSGS